jgi:hypothetical protein
MLLNAALTGILQQVEAREYEGPSARRSIMKFTLLADAGNPLIYMAAFGGMVLAGLALFAGFIIGGVWLARRLQGKPPAGSDRVEGETPP